MWGLPAIASSLEVSGAEPGVLGVAAGVAAAALFPNISCSEGRSWAKPNPAVNQTAVIKKKIRFIEPSPLKNLEPYP